MQKGLPATLERENCSGAAGCRVVAG